MACFSRIVFILCCRLHMQICMKCWSAVVLLPDCFIHIEAIFLERKVGFSLKSLKQEEFFIILELIWGVVISLDVLKVFVINLFTWYPQQTENIQRNFESNWTFHLSAWHLIHIWNSLLILNKSWIFWEGLCVLMMSSVVESLSRRFSGLLSR